MTFKGWTPHQYLRFKICAKDVKNTLIFFFLQMCPLEPPSVATNLLADGFLTTPQSSLYSIPISPLGNWEKWPDSKSPGSAVSAAKATGPNAFPTPKD
jgi:hypothetical protein